MNWFFLNLIIFFFLSLWINNPRVNGEFICNDQLKQNVSLFFDSVITYSPSCSICDSNMRSCSNNRKNLNHQPDPNPLGQVTFSGSFNNSLSTAIWIRSRITLGLSRSIRNDESSSEFDLEVYPQYINGSVISDGGDRPSSVFPLELTDQDATVSCDSCFRWILPESDQERFAAVLQDAERVQIQLKRKDGDHLCFSTAEIEACRTEAGKKTSLVSVALDKFIDNDQVTLRTNITNRGPENTPSPIITYEMPALIALQEIQFTDNNDNEMSVRIRDLRNTFPNYRRNTGNKYINSQPGSTDEDVECLLSDASPSSSYRIPGSSWIIHCRMRDDIEVDDRVFMDIIGDASLSLGGQGKLKVSVDSDESNWIPVIPGSVGSTFDVEFLPSSSEIDILEDSAFATASNNISSTFVMTTNSTGDLDPNLRILEIDIWITESEWPSSLQRNLDLYTYYIDASFETQNLSRVQFASFNFVDPNSDSNYLANEFWDLDYYNDDQVNLERGVFSQIFATSFETMASGLFSVSSSVKPVPTLAEDASLELEVDSSSPFVYFRVVLGLRDQPRAQRTLKLEFQSFSSLQVELSQEDRFPSSFQSSDTFSLSVDSSISKNIDDRKAEREGRRNIVFVGRVLYRDCRSVECTFDISANVQVFIPDELKELKLTNEDASQQFAEALPKSTSSRANRSFTIDASRSIFPSGSDLVFSEFLLGIEIDQSISTASKPAISLTLSLKRTLDENQVVRVVGSNQTLASSTIYLSYTSTDFLDILDDIDKTGNRDQVELVLDVQASDLELEASVTANVHLKILSATVYELEDPEQLRQLRPTGISPFTWPSHRIRWGDEPSILTVFSQVGVDCDVKICFGQGGMNTSAMFCQPLESTKVDFLLPSDVFSPRVRVVSLPSYSSGYEYDDNIPLTTSSRELVISWVPNPGGSLACSDATLDTIWKPAKQLKALSKENYVYEINTTTSQSYLFAIDMGAFPVSSANDVFLEWATFGDSGSRYSDFYWYYEVSYFFVYVFSESDFPRRIDTTDPDPDLSSYPKAAHYNITLPSVPYPVLVFWQAIPDESEFTVEAAVVSQGDRHQVSSVPMVLPPLGLEIAPAIVYSLGICLSCVIGSLCCNPFVIPNSDLLIKTYKNIERGFLIASGILFILALSFVGFSFIPDCTSYIRCCSYRGYREEAPDFFFYYQHYTDQPLDQDKSWPFPGYVPDNVTSEGNETVSVDCIAKPNTLGSVEEANSMCVLGDSYSTCARGTGALPILAIVLHAVSLFFLIIALCSCYGRWRKFKQSSSSSSSGEPEASRQ
eukprot:gb/GECH01000012.1/.p1 GENE.gb/GECH01000012.1/~~gb/GECH01000012.1/.p1  ORF type:complete len:1301 (+),score=258.60 gb/GECH01000012.1/:1-3903(+)